MSDPVRSDPRVRVLPDPAAIARAAAAVVLAHADEAVRERGLFTIALAGGSTPRALYALLASEERLPGDDRAIRGRMPWDRTEVFFGDERHVLPSDPQSNYLMAREAMLSKVPIPDARVHRIRAEEADPRMVASSYEAELAQALELPLGAAPRFDLILLGLGADAHSASLFPGSWAVREHRLLVAWPWVDKLSCYRITLTPRTINASRAVLFLVAGKDKAPALRAVIAPEGDIDRHPARGVSPTEGTVTFLVDEAAASGG